MDNNKNLSIPSQAEIQEALEQRHSKKLQDKISDARVAVCGLGGLGSHVAIALARCGIGSLHLIDCDCVDLTNLNRQNYAFKQLGMPKPDALKEELLRINPYLDIRTDYMKITEENAWELLKEDTYICEAFDVAEEKAMLTNWVLTNCRDKYLVGASGMAGFGESNRIMTRQIVSHYFLCGDGVSDVNEAGSLVAPRVMLCAAHQANKILELINESEGEQI